MTKKIPTPAQTFGPDVIALSLLLHLTSLLKGFEEGPFKAGLETAIEEGGAYLDSLSKDGGDQAQTLMEQMNGLVNGIYALKEIKGPIGVVQS